MFFVRFFAMISFVFVSCAVQLKAMDFSKGCPPTCERINYQCIDEVYEKFLCCCTTEICKKPMEVGSWVPAALVSASAGAISISMIRRLPITVKKMVYVNGASFLCAATAVYCLHNYSDGSEQAAKTMSALLGLSAAGIGLFFGNVS